jgi:hypothetical protein
MIDAVYQDGAMDEQQRSDFIDPPTTKIVAIGSFSKTPNEASRHSILPHEVSDTLRIYLQGKIDQLYVRKDEPGVVFLMNVATIEEASALLEDLPLGRAGLMKFHYIPIGPLWPMNFILLPKSA